MRAAITALVTVFVLVALVVTFAPRPLEAQSTGVPMNGQLLVPVSHATVVCLSTQDCIVPAATLNPANVGPIKTCEITTETNSIRFWKDGTSPGAIPNSGHLMVAASIFPLGGYTAVLQFKARAVTTPAVLQVTCSR